MKKLRALAAALAFAVLAAGCGGQSNNADSSAESASSGQESAAEETASSEQENASEAADAFPSPAQITTPEMVRNMRTFSKWDVRDTVDREFCTEITFSESGADIAGKGASADGAYVTIEQEGDYYITGTTSDGQICINADPLAKIRLIFAGVDMTCESSACVLVRMADKVLLTLADGTENRFSDTGKAYEARDGVYGVDAVIFAKEDLTVNGSGSMIVNAGYAHGICTKDDLVFYGGTVEVTAKDKGLVGEDSVRIRDCDLTVTAGDDAVHTKTDYKEGKGFIYLESGNVKLSCGDDAMHAATALIVDGGTLTVTDCKEGLEAAAVAVGAGEVDITSSDDGINAAYLLGEEEPYDADGANDPHVQEDAFILVEGGTLRINAEGDGLDTNGVLRIAGGTVLVDGPSKDGNAALDSGCGIFIDGGTVFAAGAAEEAEVIQEASKQRVLQCAFAEPLAADSEIVITGPDGAELYRGTTVKTFAHITFSAEGMQAGSYNVSAGGEAVSVEVG